MSKKDQQTELAKKQEAGALSTFTGPRRGFEREVKQEHLIIPRAKLLQGLSPEVVDGVVLEGSNDKAVPGLIINSLTKEKLPEVFIPVFWFENWIRFNPRNKKDERFNPDFEPGAIIWRSNTDKDPRVQEEAKFGPKGEKPLATTFMNFFSIFPGVPMPVIVSFANTSYKTGKTLLSLCQFSGKADMFGAQYKLSSKLVKSDELSWHVLQVQKAGFTPEDVFAQAEGLYDQFKDFASEIIVHDLDEEGEVHAASATERSTGGKEDGDTPPF